MIRIFYRIFKVQHELQENHTVELSNLKRDLYLAEKRNQTLQNEQTRLVDNLNKYENRETFSVTVQTDGNTRKLVSPGKNID